MVLAPNGLAGGTPGGRAGRLSGSGSWGPSVLDRWLAVTSGVAGRQRAATPEQPNFVTALTGVSTEIAGG
jgi:hypothetical protein